MTRSYRPHYEYDDHDSTLIVYRKELARRW
jgi:hypothetical protein